ncbi:peptide ABC transporter substrate-binding protein [Mycolicibacterium doricum]|uniref:Peptide ABC transporter substrate-binding protein n=2 Tax=Mycolicibacterium doricum TaxID=126673 RepID=A0A1X1THL3_9MYCO|nr:peptide ABC transporter substrate-binding protein [Mycolicibacterium doricum]BBZ07631.1 peptide ABC transporter substrate-binding protein [Mycolicibacterium doricum]
MRHKMRSLFAACVVAACAFTVIAGCSRPPVQTGNTFVVAIESEADLLDPQVAGGWVSWRINRQIFEPLVDEDLTIPSAEATIPPLKPGLAASWDVSADGLDYIFHIRQGVQFHDGTPLNAEAVEYNIRRMWDKESPIYSAKAGGQTSFVWKFVESVASVDEYTLNVRLKQPFSEFLRMLTQGGNGSTAIMSPTALEAYGDDIADHPVGTGPFKFAERIRGERIDLVRNDDYWGKVPYIDGVVFRPLPDPSARTAALRSGDVDMIAVPNPDSIDNLVAEGYQLSEGIPPHSWYLSFNMKDQYTSIPEVRQAINLAIDREGMARDLLRGSVTPAYGVQAMSAGGYVERRDAYERNLDEARRLLASVDLQDGFQTTLITSTDGSGQIMPAQMAEFIQQNLAEIGIEVAIQTQEWISYLGVWARGMQDGVGMAQMSWGMTSPYWLYIATSSELQAPDGPNVGYYSNPQLDEAMNNAITALDPAKADEYWRQANNIVSDDHALAPIVNDKAPYMLAPYVSGFVSASEEWYDLTEVRLEQ